MTRMIADRLSQDGEWARLASFAMRLRGDARFMASALDHYARLHDLAFEDLAGVLGCEADGLTRLAMCLRPAGGLVPLPVQVHDLAEFAGIAEARLMRVLQAASEDGGREGCA